MKQLELPQYNICNNEVTHLKTNKIMYTINDTIEVRRQGKTYRATVTKGPFKVPGEKLLHYHAKWNDQEYETIETFFSTKYNYKLI